MISFPIYSTDFEGDGPSGSEPALADLYPFSYVEPAGFRFRYHLAFDQLRPFALDEHVARFNLEDAGRDDVVLRTLAWRSNTVDTTSFFAMLAAYLSGGASWDTLHIRGGLERSGSSEVKALIEWVDAAGNAHMLAESGALAMAAGDYYWITFHIDTDENNLKVARVYTSPLADPDDLTLRAEAFVPLEVDQSGNGHVGIYLASADPPGEPFAFGGIALENFSYGIQLPPCALHLSVFDDDKITRLWSVGNYPEHPFPFLVDPENYQEQTLDVAGGKATIGTVSVAVIDKAQIAGDQDSGWMTEKLADLGLANLAGRRCRLLRYIDDTIGAMVIADGPASAPRLASDYASYSWEIRDTRETERRIRCFDLVGLIAPTPTEPVAGPPTQVPGSGFDIDWGTETN